MIQSKFVNTIRKNNQNSLTRETKTFFCCKEKKMNKKKKQLLKPFFLLLILSPFIYLSTNNFNLLFWTRLFVVLIFVAYFMFNKKAQKSFKTNFQKFQQVRAKNKKKSIKIISFFRLKNILITIKWGIIVFFVIYLFIFGFIFIKNLL